MYASNQIYHLHILFACSISEIKACVQSNFRGTFFNKCRCVLICAYPLITGDYLQLTLLGEPSIEMYK